MPEEKAPTHALDSLASTGQETSLPHPYTFAADLLKSKFVLALLFFFAIDLLFRVNFRPDRFDLPEHNQIWWSVNGFRHLDHPPDILIFGSSLMISVTNDGDAAFLKQPLDSAVHHSSICLEQHLSQSLKVPISSYSFAVGGQMASDVYAIEKTLVDVAHHPRVIIWGIAPRDLVDAAFDGPSSSDTARYMNKIANARIIPPDHRSLPGYIEGALRNVSYLFRTRTDLNCLKQNCLRQSRTNIENIANKLSPPLFRKSLSLNGEPPQEIEIGDSITPVCSAYPSTIKDNTEEYKKRYNPFKMKHFIEQASYLEKVLSTSKHLSTRVVLVNMPLTSENMRLMPAGVYDSYLSEVRYLAGKYDADVLDLNGAKLFPKQDFSDTAHLNGLGGEKLAKMVAKHLGQYWPKESTPQVKAQCR